MAVPVSVPPHQRAAIEELTSLTEGAYSALREFLERVGPFAEPTPLIEQTSKALESHTRLGGQVLGTIIGLRSLVDRSALSTSDVAEAVAEDVQIKKWIPKETREVLRRRLSELLEIKSVALSSKAFTLSVGDEAPFADVRIFSDVRPIFSGSDTDLDLAGSVIVHHMVIEVGPGGEDQYCALATADLLKLKRTVERAIEKDKKLRKALRDSPIAPLESEASSTASKEA